MLFIHLTTVALIALVVSSTTIKKKHIPNDDDAAFPSDQSILEYLDLVGGPRLDDQIAEIDKRDISFGPYSRVAKLNGFIQWTFGNDTNQYNISLDACAQLDDVVGVWDMEDGTRKYNASIRDIVTDLGFGIQNGSTTRSGARLLANQAEAGNEVHEYLDTLLCPTTSSSPRMGRDLVTRQPNTGLLGGYKLATVFKTSLGIFCGIMAQEISNKFQADGWQIAAGMLGGGIVVAGYDFIAYQQIQGRFTNWQSAIAGIWTAMIRWIIYLSQGAPHVAGPCQQEMELENMAAGLAQASDPDIRFLPTEQVTERTQSCPGLIPGL